MYVDGDPDVWKALSEAGVLVRGGWWEEKLSCMALPVDTPCRVSAFSKDELF